MIEEQAKVVHAAQGRLIIESSRSFACGQCHANQTCGQKAISEWASSKMTRLEIDNPSKIYVKVGDQVIVGIDEGSFLKASALIYLLPLLILVLFGALADFFGFSETIVILSAFSGLFLGFMGVKLWSQHFFKHCQFKPVLLRTF